jgi:hypothetical protein
LARPQHRGILTWWWITMLHRSWCLGNKNPTEIVVKSTEIVVKWIKMMVLEVLSLVVAINENQWTSPCSLMFLAKDVNQNVMIMVYCHLPLP